MGEDFKKEQKHKIVKAITNFKNYVEKNATNATYVKRLIDFKLSLELANHPYAFFKSVITDPAFDTVRDEFRVLYWFTRHLNKFNGQIPLDDEDELINLITSTEILAANEEKIKNWNYARMINSIFAGISTGPATSEFSNYCANALDIIAPLLPNTGSISLLFTDEKGKSDFKKVLSDKGLVIPETIWKKGKKLPPFSSERPAAESY